MVLDHVVLARGEGGRWRVVDRDGHALPVDPSTGDPWRLVAAGGGAPATLVGEWATPGLRPLSLFTDRLVLAT
jgi:hypothetical protein